LFRNSANSYFNAFLSIVHFAYKDNILSEDYAAMAEKIKWNHDIPKEENKIGNIINTIKTGTRIIIMPSKRKKNLSILDKGISLV
jgi:hypothetical protein